MAKKVLVWGIVHYVAVGDPPKNKLGQNDDRDN